MTDYKPKEWQYLEELYRQQNVRINELDQENKKLREENEILRCSKGGTPEKVGHEEFIQYLMEENKKLKEEVKQLRNQRIFNSTEYDLITLTSTTPQWELRRK